jgi:hypothetical protein
VAAVAASVVLGAALLLPARPSRRRRGGVLVAGYLACVVAFLVAG